MISTDAKLQSTANAQQLEAILATDGPVLIIAGPGSGKTFTLVERIVYLITNKGIAPESLFVVTFTDKAARELTTRISNRLTDLGIKFNLNEMYLGTFHSICLRLLEDYREFTRLKRSFTLFDQFDQQYFLYQRIKEFRELPDAQLVMGDDQSGRWAQSENLLKWLNKVSEEALDVAALAAAPDVEIRALAACFAKYQELLHENNSLDFSGIQYEALQLLETHPEVLMQVREKLSYLMVDEYQDTNTIQERILLLLAGEKKNLCVVGDDDQGLYRFRGATIRNILEFPALFNEGQCKQVQLTARSPPTTTSASSIVSILKVRRSSSSCWSTKDARVGTAVRCSAWACSASRNRRYLFCKPPCAVCAPSAKPSIPATSSSRTPTSTPSTRSYNRTSALALMSFKKSPRTRSAFRCVLPNHRSRSNWFVCASSTTCVIR
ncbi:ATP-dependent helicase [Achromobacter ruhlandii]|uniref:ATP-dependent helicase n=1 Tax=Achromobacter ruhlandii TaxID=72557 RepID=UPI0006C48B16|nr:UvrD-helicase domain-containing protein [Achromobacter ruhlandii]CUI26011.1 ATP-dependent DNA helicase pcrA [Achromobacter ruhlandii]CUI41046.1 ATP-dependent DNA helicase pcrA [Achromobacter ruhlandii]CUJ93993.1 ATP-dependent DNA helicase pcrA [Achromobacter ruhlandii]